MGRKRESISAYIRLSLSLSLSLFIDDRHTSIPGSVSSCVKKKKRYSRDLFSLFFFLFASPRLDIDLSLDFATSRVCSTLGFFPRLRQAVALRSGSSLDLI